MLTFEESSKDVQEAEEEIPVAAAEEMLEAEEEEEKKEDNKEEEPREEEKEGGDGDDEGGAEELQWLSSSMQCSWKLVQSGKRCFKRKILLRQFSGEDLLLDYDYNGLQFAGSIENTSEWKSTIALICVLGENLLLIELCLSEAKGYCWPARNKLWISAQINCFDAIMESHG